MANAKKTVSDKSVILAKRIESKKVIHLTRQLDVVEAKRQTAIAEFGVLAAHRQLTRAEIESFQEQAKEKRVESKRTQLANIKDRMRSKIEKIESFKRMSRPEMILAIRALVAQKKLPVDQTYGSNARAREILATQGVCDNDGIRIASVDVTACLVDSSVVLSTTVSPEQAESLAIESANAIESTKLDWSADWELLFIRAVSSARLNPDDNNFGKDVIEFVESIGDVMESVFLAWVDNDGKGRKPSKKIREAKLSAIAYAMAQKSYLSMMIPERANAGSVCGFAG